MISGAARGRGAVRLSKGPQGQVSQQGLFLATGRNPDFLAWIKDLLGWAPPCIWSVAKEISMVRRQPWGGRQR